MLAQFGVPRVCLELLENVFRGRYDRDVKKKEGALSDEWKCKYERNANCSRC